MSHLAKGEIPMEIPCPINIHVYENPIDWKMKVPSPSSWIPQTWTYLMDSMDSYHSSWQSKLSKYYFHQLGFSMVLSSSPVAPVTRKLGGCQGLLPVRELLREGQGCIRQLKTWLQTCEYPNPTTVFTRVLRSLWCIWNRSRDQKWPWFIIKIN